MTGYLRETGRGWTFLPTLDTQVALRNSYDFRATIEPDCSSAPFTLTLERSRLQHFRSSRNKSRQIELYERQG